MRKSNPMLAALVQAAQNTPAEHDERPLPSADQATRETLLGKQSGQALRDLVDEKNVLIAELQAKVDAQASAGQVTELDPSKDLVPSKYNPRLERSLRVEALSELLEEIREAGTNVQPILVRPVKFKGADGKEYTKYGIVYGHRRSKCCEMLGRKVRAVVMELTDVEVALYQAQENEGQEKPSLFEYGVAYEEMLKDKVFSSQGKLSEGLGVPAATVGNRLLAARVGRPFEALGLDATMLTTPVSVTLRDWFQGQGISLASDGGGEQGESSAQLAAVASELVAVAGVRPTDKEPFKAIAGAAKRWNRAPHPSRRKSFDVDGVGTIEVLSKPKETVVTIPGRVDLERLKAILVGLK